ncbi:MAG: hypothetical protein RL021_930 [Bacteroidota bacterium]
MVSLLDLIDHGLESGRMVHGKIGKGLTVQLKTFCVDLTHELGVAHAVLAGTGVDTLDPQAAEVALLGTTVTVCVLESFFDRVLGYGPNISSRTEVPLGELQDLFTTGLGSDVIY